MEKSFQKLEQEKTKLEPSSAYKGGRQEAPQWQLLRAVSSSSSHGFLPELYSPSSNMGFPPRAISPLGQSHLCSASCRDFSLLPPTQGSARVGIFTSCCSLRGCTRGRESTPPLLIQGSTAVGIFPPVAGRTLWLKPSAPVKDGHYKFPG